jgi:tetratricopeptide (TPR) repeat protein
MTVTISELHDWFRSERLSAAHNALIEILVTGAPADVLCQASQLLARLRMGIGQLDAALMQLETSPAPAREDEAARQALMAVGYAFKRCFSLADASMDRACAAGSAPFVALCRAMLETERGALLSAGARYREALGDHRDARFACKGLSETLRAAGHAGEAASALEGLVEKDGDWAGTHRALAYHAMALGRYEQASESFTRAIEAAPDGDYVPHDSLGRGRALCAAGMRADAASELERLASRPGSAAAAAGRALSRLGAAPPDARRRVLAAPPAPLVKDTALPAALSLYIRLLGREPSEEPLPGDPPVWAPMPPWSVLDHLERAGFEARMFHGTTRNIAALLEEGVPVLTFESFHVTGQASAACGHDGVLGDFLLMDPLTGLLSEMPEEEFELRAHLPAIAAAPPDRASALDRVEPAPHLVEACRGHGLRGEGRADEAEEAWRAAIRAEPACEPAHEGLLGMLLARTAADLTDDAARKAFEEALENTARHVPGRPLIQLYRGRYRRLLGQHTRALASLREAAAADPEDVHALCDQASALLATGSAEEGAELLRRALSLAPHHPRPNLDLADLHAGLNEHRQAGHYVGCALALDPGSAFGHEILAMVHRSSGRFAEALEALDRAGALGSDTDWLHLERAICHMELGRWDEALNCLEVVVGRDDSNIDARARLVEVLSRLGRGEEAVEAARFLLTLDPGVARSHTLHAMALETAGRDDSAESEYSHALEISQEHMEARERLDGLLARQGRHADRVGLWLVAARRDPAHPGIMDGLASALDADGKSESAERVRRRACIAGGGPALPLLEGLRAECADHPEPRALLEEAAGSGDRAVILAELGRILILSGDPDAAAVWKQVAGLEPSDPVPVAMMAHALHADDERLKQMDEPRDAGTLVDAAQAMDHVIEMEPYWIWARVERGRIGLDMNKPEDALAVLEPVTEERMDVWDVRMTAHSRLGRHEQASAAGDRLLEACGPAPSPADLVRIARIHSRAGRSRRARDLAERALENLPADSALRTSAEALLE